MNVPVPVAVDDSLVIPTLTGVSAGLQLSFRLAGGNPSVWFRGLNTATQPVFFTKPPVHHSSCAQGSSGAQISRDESGVEQPGRVTRLSQGHTEIRTNIQVNTYGQSSLRTVGSKPT